MNRALDQALADYLALRRALGYKLERAGKLLAQFVGYLDEIGAGTITIEHAVAWATLPAAGDGSWWAYRLSVVRGFAAYVRTIDPATEVPPTDLLPCRKRRATPYVYSDAEIAAVLAAADGLRGAGRTATYQTLVGLLAVTGMRVGEAIRLDRDDLDLDAGVLVVRDSKFGKSRRLPLHPTTTAALAGYLRHRDQVHPTAATPAVFVSTAGTRLLYCNVQHTFARLAGRAGLRPRSATCRPRVHDLRHTFAVNTVLDATVPASTPRPGCRGFRPTSGTSTRPTPTGTCRPLRSCSRSPASASKTTSSRAADDRARADPAGVLHRPARRSAPRQ